MEPGNLSKISFMPKIFPPLGSDRTVTMSAVRIGICTRLENPDIASPSGVRMLRAAYKSGQFCARYKQWTGKRFSTVFGKTNTPSVTHAALFGSRVRGDNRSDSDIDLMIDIDPETVQDIYAYVGLKNYIAELFSEPVDVVTRDALKPYVRPLAETDAVYAF